MNDTERAIIGKVIQKAEINGYGIKLIMDDGTILDYDSSDAGMSIWSIENELIEKG